MKQIKYLWHFADIPDQVVKSPESILSFDEAVLDWAEANQPGENMIYFWESPQIFAVLGFSNKYSTELNVEACRRDAIPVGRRISGGGTVLQGPGCLNYSLILRIESSPELEAVTSTNSYVMNTMANGLSNNFNLPVQVKGITDLVMAGKKFSGNAQRRKRNYLLFHGSILYAFDLPLIEKYLGFPSWIPDYREGRSHLEFVSNFPFQREDIMSSILNIWDGHGTLIEAPEIVLNQTLKKMNTVKFKSETWINRL